MPATPSPFAEAPLAAAVITGIGVNAGYVPDARYEALAASRVRSRY